MAKYRITGPDGGTYEVSAPDTATEAEVLAYAQQNYKGGEAPKQPEPLKADPTGTTLQNVAAGAGKAVADAGRGVVLRSGQALANAPASLPLLKGLSMVLEKVGLSPTAAVADAKAGITESRRLDAPLMNTGGGIAGNLAGNVAMLAPTVGANTPAAAGVVGGLAGLAQPALTWGEGALNTGLGAAGGAFGQWLGGKAPGMLQGRIDKAKAAQAGNAQKFNAARNASAEGYVIPPADLEPGMLSEAVSGLSGKIKTAQEASARNQTVTDKLARKAIGLKPGDELSTDTLLAIRRQAAEQGYAPIRNAGAIAPDGQFSKALDAIVASRKGAERSFPGLGKTNMHGQPVDEIGGLVDALRVGQFDAGDAVDAIKVLRETADTAYGQGNRELGKASKAAAGAMEDMLDRHLSATGQADALKAFREARQLIAKTYSVQKGLNSETGNVSAQALAKQLEKGKPLSGELLTIGKTASAFPKATQALKESPKAVSPLDFAVATTTGISTGNPLSAALLGARPLARNALLSGPVQARALQQGAPAPFSQATQAVLQNRLAQLLFRPVGTVAPIQVNALNVGQ
jgi:hypothetical protein